MAEMKFPDRNRNNAQKAEALDAEEPLELWNTGAQVPPEETLEKQRRMARRALEKDSPKAQEESEKKAGFLKQAWWLLRPAIICCAVLLLINAFLLMYALVPTGSMEPLIMPHSFILANRRAYDQVPPQRGDVIVFDTDQNEAKRLVKRVVAVAGETVELRDGDVYVDGRRLDESGYAVGKTYPNIAGTTFHVPQGCVLVFGDNRGDSADARYWSNPYLPVEQIKGRVFLAFSFKDHYFRILDAGGGDQAAVLQ